MLKLSDFGVFQQSATHVLDCTLLEPVGDCALINPFHRQMGHQSLYGGSDATLQSPLPVSSAGDEPGVLESINGLFTVSWPSMHLVALAGAPATLPLATRDWYSVVYVVDGIIKIQQQGQDLNGCAGDCLLLPTSTAHWSSSAYNVVCLMIPPEWLMKELKTMQYQDFISEPPLGWDLSQPCCRKASDGVIETCLLTTLRHLFNLIGELVLTQSSLVPRLGILRQLCLLTGLLASASDNQDLLLEDNLPRGGGVDDAIEELTSYMKENLDAPLNLSILEKHSHYSRRALQYAFRKKYGCTITQWIRSQRLDLAYQKMQHANSNDSVASIAIDCGYRSVSIFSIEFQKRFHIKPSAFLRDHQNPFT